MRKTKITALLLVILLLFYGINKSLSWYKVYTTNGEYEYILDGEYLTYSKAKSASVNYDSDNKYYYKYTIIKKYETQSFPFITCDIDTVNYSLWSRKNNNNNK